MPALLSEAFKDADSNIRSNSKLPTDLPPYTSNTNPINDKFTKQVNAYTIPLQPSNIIENNKEEIQQDTKHQGVLEHVRNCPECKEKIINMVLEESRTENNILKNRIVELERKLEKKKTSFMSIVMEFIDEYPLLALLIVIIGIDVFSKIFKK